MSRSDRIQLALGGGALVLALVAVSVLLSPAPGAGAAEPIDDAPVLLESASPSSLAPSTSPQSSTVVVDVEGAVVEPGIRELPAGSRIADAIAAAGGYAPDVDLDAAATAINLAQRLADGDQIVVPRAGAQAADAPSAGAGQGAEVEGADEGAEGDGGLINLNTATAGELEGLPGIGPVTVEKIIAAREERPFESLEDAVQRGVIHRGQLEDIQGLATAG